MVKIKGLLMKKIVFLTLLGSLSLFAHTLTVEISNIENNNGQILIGLYNQSEGFTEVDAVYKKGLLSTLNNGIFTYTFTDIPDGDYAVSLFHDENSNSELDTNFIGIPKEGYGFSNNVRPTFRPATFDEAKFTLASDLSLSVTMGY